MEITIIIPVKFPSYGAYFLFKIFGKKIGMSLEERYVKDICLALKNTNDVDTLSTLAWPHP